jgi:hypothetical protein
VYVLIEVIDVRACERLHIYCAISIGTCEFNGETPLKGNVNSGSQVASKESVRGH